MVSGKYDSLPKIELNLTATTTYREGVHEISVYTLQTYSEYPVYTQMLEPKGPFNVDTVIVDGNYKLKINKKNVSMVTVFFDKSNKILLFETYYEDEKVRKDLLIHRYHARDIKTTTGESPNSGKSTEFCWMEYMYGNNDTLDKTNVDGVLKIYEKKNTPLNMIQVSGKYFLIVKSHEYCYQYCGYSRDYSDKTLAEVPITEKDLEAQTTNETGFVDFITTSKGMITAVVTGSVGGAAIGGTLIYMVSS